MADTLTTNYSLTKPEIGASNDSWGTKINANLDVLDTTIKAVSNVANAITAAYTAADVLAKLLTVDGAGSGLDADLLDGQSSAYYIDIPTRLGYTPVNKAGDTMTGNLTIASNVIQVGTASAGAGGNLRLVDDGGTFRYLLGFLGSAGNRQFSVYDAVAGLDRIVVETNGNVGIGVNPSEKFHVAGNIRITSGASYYWGNATSQITAVDSGAMRFLVGDGGEKVRIAANGDVGIGGTPSFKLDVTAGSAATALNLNSTNISSYNAAAYNGAGARMFMRGGSATGAFTGTQFTHGGSFEAFFGTVQNASGLPDFVFQGYNGVAYEERMRVNSTGNLGIGGSPTTRLSIFQNTANVPAIARVTNSASGNSFDYAAFSVNAVGISGGIAAWGTGSLRAGTMWLGVDQALPLVFGTNDTERARIDGSGIFTYGGLEVGYKNIPRVTGGLEAGKCLATSSNVNFGEGPVGGAFSVYNNSASAITLTQGSGVTMRLGGTTTTGSRTLAPRGFATVWYNAAFECIVAGSGVT